jgi:hypothetical protein
MKTYTIKLHGNSIKNTKTIEVKLKGLSKSMAFNWAHTFFQKGIFREPYKDLKGETHSTEKYIPECKSLMHLKGKYTVLFSNIKEASN